MRQLLLDLALSRRIELAEAKAAVACAEMLRKHKPDSGAAVQDVAGGYAVFAGANSPVTQAVGLGLKGPVSEEEFSRLEDFYRSRNEAARIEASPLADPSLFKHFAANGYGVTEFTNVMARAVSEEDRFRGTNSDIQVELIPKNAIDVWVRTVSQGFAGEHAVNSEILDVMGMFAMAEGIECYLARVDGAHAGGGTLAIRDGVAGLFGAGTLPAFRNRGVQSALLAARLARAVEAGCDLAVCLAQPGTSSQRNIVRYGFSVLYTRAKFERHWQHLTSANL
jgi:GNAT superfamily N-acetyltransferase